MAYSSDKKLDDLLTPVEAGDDIFTNQIKELVAATEEKAAASNMPEKGSFQVVVESDEMPGFRRGDIYLYVAWTCEPGKPVEFTEWSGPVPSSVRRDLH